MNTNPLSYRMRPATLACYVGQEHLLSPGKPLFLAITQKKLHSMILWGSPGVGKTALAELIANASHAVIERLSAVLSGVKEIREVIERAEARLSVQKTVLFVDEIHRFNKAQQDAFLPHVEKGTIILIGATTENPSFHLNNALLSRVRVYVLKQLTEDNLLVIINNALLNKEEGYGNYEVFFENELKVLLSQSCDSDARTCLNILEILGDFCIHDNKMIVTKDILLEVLSQQIRKFDKNGDIFYDQISALHKSVRGTDPDAAIYWFSRMIDAGCDPHYIARRIVRIASEDIGNADPRALTLALNAWDAYDRLGSPEGELALAQAVIFLACAAKSNATYLAYQNAMSDVKKYGTLEVPLHLRNAPTALMKALDYGKNYKYAHDQVDAYVTGEVYLPEKLKNKVYYTPVMRGLEISISEKLKKLK